MTALNFEMINEFIDKRILNILRNINLADPQFYEPSGDYAIVGAEIFYDLLRRAKI